MNLALQGIRLRTQTNDVGEEYVTTGVVSPNVENPTVAPNGQQMERSLTLPTRSHLVHLEGLRDSTAVGWQRQVNPEYFWRNGRTDRVLDVRAAQHRVILSNIANEETPGYRAKEIHFTDPLAAARHDTKALTMHITNTRHLMLPSTTKQLAGRIAEVSVADLPLDANSVNFELEMA